MQYSQAMQDATSPPQAMLDGRLIGLRFQARGISGVVRVVPGTSLKARAVSDEYLSVRLLGIRGEFEGDRP